MAWIEVHQSLPPHRKIKRLKRLLKIKTPQAVGHVVMLWLWALDNAPEGCLDDLSSDDLAEAAEWTGDPDRFAYALREAGFVDEGDSLLIHDWQEYGGRLQAQRKDRAEQNRERQRRYRDRQKDRDSNVTETQRNAVTVTDRNADVTRYGNVTETQRNATTLHYTTLPKNTPPNGGVTKSVTPNEPSPPTTTEAAAAYTRLINPTPSTSSMRELLEFERQMGSEVCLKAIDAALDAGAKNWNYIRQILRDKQQAGVKSIDDWNRLEANRTDAKAKRTPAPQKKAQPCPADYGIPGTTVDRGDVDWILREGLV